MATVTYKVPEVHKGGKITYAEKSGDVAWLTIGDRKLKCVMQKDGEYVDLVHYASGGRIIRHDTIKGEQLRFYVQSGGCKMTPREAAWSVLSGIIMNKGADHVLKVVDAAPVLNA